MFLFFMFSRPTRHCVRRYNIVELLEQMVPCSGPNRSIMSKQLIKVDARNHRVSLKAAHYQLATTFADKPSSLFGEL